MIILAVDTTTPSGSVALVRQGRIISELGMDSSLTHSERLLPAVEFVLKTSGFKIEDIEGFALAVGPGSFTGVRIGLSTIKSLAYASGKMVAPLSSLEALAFKVRRPRRSLVCPIIDAKKSEVYGALFVAEGDKMREIVPQCVASPDELFSRLPAHRIIHFIGSGVRIYREKISGYFADKARIVDRTEFIAGEVGLLGARILESGRGKNFLDIEPLYLRRSQAEENLKSSGISDKD